MARTSAKTSSAKTGGSFLGIRIYSLTFVAGILAAYFIARRRILKSEIPEKVFEDIVFWTILVGFISARIYYVLFYFDQYKNNLSEIFKIWHGGLAIYGGLIGGALTVLFLCRRHKIDFFRFSDLIVVGFPLGQAIGRLGNYFNHEAFGAPTNLSWKIFIPAANRPAGYAQYSYFHPAFLYEMIADLLIFIILSRSALKPTPKPQPSGMLAAWYLLLYSTARLAIEGIRLDSAYFGPFKGDQLTAGAIILLSIGLMVYLRHFRYNKGSYVT